MEGSKLSEAEEGRSDCRVRRKEDRSSVGTGYRKADGGEPAYVEAMANALGSLWCSMKGIECKDLRQNKFLFTFHQPSRKKKAADRGPWIFYKGLIFMEDFAAVKTMGEYEFNKISLGPAWFVG